MDDYIAKRAERHLEARGHEFYSAEDVDRLCCMAKVSAAFAPVILKTLQSAAEEWFEQSAQEAEDIESTEKELARLSKTARQFSDALNGVSREAWDAMMNASGHPALAHRIWLDVETPNELVPGSIVLRVDDQGEGRRLSSVTTSDLRQFTDAVRDLAGAGVFEFPKSGRGRSESHALKTWVLRMHRLWSVELGLRFTAGHMNGVEATTHACAFCVEAFRQLDPDMPPQRIHTEIRKSITVLKRLHSSQ